MAWCRRCGAIAACGRQRSNAASTRAWTLAIRAVKSRVVGTGPIFQLVCFENLYLFLGAREHPLAVLCELQAALVSGKRLLQAQLAGLHARHDFLQLGERGFKALGRIGLRGFGAHLEAFGQGTGKIAHGGEAVKSRAGPKNPWCPEGKRSRIARIFLAAPKEPPGRMSDLSGSRTLKPNASQLPVSWYFDPRVFQLEQEVLFATGPKYVGHELMLPNSGDYHTLAWMDHGKVLVRNSRGI